MNNKTKVVGTIEVPADYMADVDYQREAVEHIESMKDKAQAHILHTVFGITGGIDKSLPCFNQPTDPEFELPSKEVVAMTVEIMKSRGYGKAKISDLLGISKNGSNQLLNYWMRPDSDKRINKSNWVLLATLAGLMLPLMAEDLSEQQR